MKTCMVALMGLMEQIRKPSVDVPAGLIDFEMHDKH
jgi:hypothetical protein